MIYHFMVRLFGFLGLLFLFQGCDTIADSVFFRTKVYGDIPLTNDIVLETVVLLKDKPQDYDPSVSGLLFERIRYKEGDKNGDVNRVFLGVGKDVTSFFMSDQLQKGRSYRVSGKYFGTSWYGCNSQPSLIPNFPPCMDTTGLMVFNIASFYIKSIEPIP
ncbi:MAG: hypothetical protein J0L94_16250 [Rhodothermia bacterium]|nr:hypothetical protein [Rhodothermia bacterium]